MMANIHYYGVSLTNYDGLLQTWHNSVLLTNYDGLLLTRYISMLLTNHWFIAEQEQ